MSNNSYDPFGWGDYFNRKAWNFLMSNSSSLLRSGSLRPDRWLGEGLLSSRVHSRLDLPYYGETQRTKVGAKNTALVPVDPSIQSAIARMNAGIARLSSAASYGDFVGKRQEWVQAKGTSPSTAIVPYGYFTRPGRGAMSGEDARRWAKFTMNPFAPPNMAGITEHIPISSFTKTPEYPEAPIAENAYPVATAEQAERWRYERDYGARMSAKSRGRKAALMRAGLSDYERFIHDHQAEYGGKANADAVYRKMLLKELPRFFRNSKLSTKELVKISETYKSLKKMPLVGGFVKHPVIAGLGLALAGLKFFAGKNEAANEGVVGMQNSINLYGTPSKRFTEAALNAGYNDYGKISQLWGKLTAKYGDAESVIMGLGPMMGKMSPLERMNIAKSFGLNADEMAVFDIMSRNGRIGGKNAESRRMNYLLNRAIIEETLGFSSNTKGLGYQATNNALMRKLGLFNIVTGLGLGGLDSEDEAAKFYQLIRSSLLEGAENADRAHEAARSLDRAKQSNTDAGKPEGGANGNSVSFYINNLDVKADDAGALVESLENAGKSRYGSLDVMNASAASVWKA